LWPRFAGAALSGAALAGAGGHGLDGLNPHLPAHCSKPSHQPAAGPEPLGSADRDGAAGGALQLAGKGEGLLGRDQPHLFDGLAAAAQELLLAGMGTAFDASGIEVDGHATDFAAVG
jgi:hypothetical protein